jgi:hypothetical protein
MMMLDESEHKHKLNTLLESGEYESLPKDPAATGERTLQKLHSKYTNLTNLKRKLMPHHSKLLDILLRQIFSSISSACYTLVGFLHKFHFSTILK